jgi:hypothetical protein
MVGLILVLDATFEPDFGLPFPPPVFTPPTFKGLLFDCGLFFNALNFR